MKYPSIIEKRFTAETIETVHSNKVLHPENGHDLPNRFIAKSKETSQKAMRISYCKQPSQF